MRKNILYQLTSFIVIFMFHMFYNIWKSSQISNQWTQIENISLLSLYFERQDFFLGYSFGLAGAFIVYALLKFLENRRTRVTGDTNRNPL